MNTTQSKGQRPKEIPSEKWPTSPTCSRKRQTITATKLSSHIGNRDPGPRGFLQDPQLLVDGIPSTALNTRINLNTLCIRRHSRITRLTPSSYLRQHCPVEMGAAPPKNISSKFKCQDSRQKYYLLEEKKTNNQQGVKPVNLKVGTKQQVKNRQYP